MRASILLASTLLLWARPWHAQAQPTARARTTPEREIAAVDAAYRAVERATLVRRDSTVQCADALEQQVTRYVDSAGTVRRLTWETGTDDHAETHEFYYDRAGRLRFIFSSFGAVNGTGVEERVFYAPDRRRLRRRRNRIAGPGYPFASVEPVWRPNQWLRQLCSAR